MFDQAPGQWRGKGAGNRGAELEDVGIVLPGISLASLRGPVGITRAGCGSVADWVSGAIFFSDEPDVARAMVPECVAELCDHVRPAGHDSVSGLAAWLLTR